MKVYKCCFCGERFETPLERMRHIQENKRCRLAGGHLLIERLNTKSVAGGGGSDDRK